MRHTTKNGDLVRICYPKGKMGAQVRTVLDVLTNVIAYHVPGNPNNGICYARSWIRVKPGLATARAK
jgi:hypothetical protein